MVCIAFQRFMQQPLGKSLVLVEGTAPSFNEDLSYGRSEADLAVD